MKKYLSHFSLIVLIMTAISCVPARKYKELQASKDQTTADLDALRKKHEALEGHNKELESQLAMLNSTADGLRADTTRLGQRNREIQSELDEIVELHSIATGTNAAMLNQATTEKQKLMLELDATRSILQKKEDALKLLEQNLSEKELALQEREKRLNELETLFAQQEAASNALKKKVSDALMGFQNKGLTVEQKNGKVYVKMEAKLLFPSGSTQIDPEGKKALKDLAKAIENESEMEIVVEGHTDTDKISSTSIPRDNWELSVLRATEVIKFMTANSTLKPSILTASGRSEYHPVDPADKAKNRRIEIILQPKLDELYELIDSK